MIIEERAARVVFRIFAPPISFEAFGRVLTASQRPEWNEAVRLIADAIRDAVDEAILCQEPDAPRSMAEWEMDEYLGAVS